MLLHTILLVQAMLDPSLHSSLIFKALRIHSYLAICIITRISINFNDFTPKLIILKNLYNASQSFAYYSYIFHYAFVMFHMNNISMKFH